MEPDKNYLTGEHFPQPVTDIKVVNGEVVAVFDLAGLNYYVNYAAEYVAVVAVNINDQRFIYLLPYGGVWRRTSEA